MAQAHAATLFGTQKPLDPGEALELVMALTQAEIDYYSRRIDELTADDVAGPVVSTLTRPLKEEKGAEDPSIEVVETRQDAPALNIWLTARAAAMDRLAQYAKLAADVGIDERRTALAEGAAAALYPVLRDILAALELSAEQRRRAPDIVTSHLRLLEGGAVDSTAEVLT
jgi:hypothetical protein